MSTSYAAWSLDKLKKEAAKLEKAIRIKESVEKKQVVAELRAVAKKHGFALSELVAATVDSPSKKSTRARTATPVKKRLSTGKSKKRAKAKVKYRNPNNHQETWTGRGRQPRWVAGFIENGGSLEQLSV